MSDTIVSPAGKARLASIDALRGFDMFWIMGGDALIRTVCSFAKPENTSRFGQFLRWCESSSDKLVDAWKLRPYGISGFRASALAEQLEHVRWEGFRFYDLIFPLFLFVVGVVLPFSLGKYGEGAEGRRKAIWRILARFVLLMSLALLYAGILDRLSTFEWSGVTFLDPILLLLPVAVVLPLRFLFGSDAADDELQPWSQAVARIFGLLCLGILLVCLSRCKFEGFRWTGVLQRIVLCYFVSAIAVVALPKFGQALFGGTLVGGYAALLLFVAAPERQKADFSPEGNLSSYIDQKILKEKMHARLYYVHGDNEGLLSTLGAIGTSILGVMAGHWLRSGNRPWLKFLGLMVAGAALVWAGQALNAKIPIIKNIWTPSFVLLTGGWCMVLLALFYGIIDGMGLRAWSFFFIVIGMNAITIYFAPRLIDFGYAARFFVGGLLKSPEMVGYTTLITILATLAMKWLFLHFLYRKNVFLRA